ncbi:MAG TPA: mercuric transporter MerT family protein, partial [Herpetosiphonaceae bacterium]|nr:mercuric transporter MerT family protein [Herpetosiphonaceae bacterium]
EQAPSLPFLCAATRCGFRLLLISSGPVPAGELSSDAAEQHVSCLLRMVLFGLGMSAAWIGNVPALAQGKPVLVALTFVVLGLWFAQNLPRPQARCSEP